MTKSHKTIIISAIASALFLTGLDMLPSKLLEKKDTVYEKVADIASATLTNCIETDDSLLCGIVCIKETGSRKEPETVIVARFENNPPRIGLFGYDKRRVAIVPGAVMQTTTLTWLVDHHGVREEFLLSSRYCIDSLVMSTDLRKGLFWYFDDYFGSSRAQRLPNLYLINYPELLAVADGSGLLLSAEQIVNFYDILANGGLRPRRRYYPRKQVCSEETAATMHRLLRENVLEGTGQCLAHCNVSIAGETGYGVMDRGFVPGNKYIVPEQPMSVSTFAGFFPADAPRYTMMISVIKKDDSIPETVKAMDLYQEIVEQMQKEGLL